MFITITPTDDGYSIEAIAKGVKKYKCTTIKDVECRIRNLLNIDKGTIKKEDYALETAQKFNCKQDGAV